MLKTSKALFSTLCFIQRLMSESFQLEDFWFPSSLIKFSVFQSTKSWAVPHLFSWAEFSVCDVLDTKRCLKFKATKVFVVLIKAKLFYLPFNRPRTINCETHVLISKIVSKNAIFYYQSWRYQIKCTNINFFFVFLRFVVDQESYQLSSCIKCDDSFKKCSP